MHLFCTQTLATLAADPVASLVDTAYLGRYGAPATCSTSCITGSFLVTCSRCLCQSTDKDCWQVGVLWLASSFGRASPGGVLSRQLNLGKLLCAGSSELAAVGVALSIFGTVTKLLNVPLLSVTTNIVATAVGSNKGDHTSL